VCKHRRAKARPLADRGGVITEEAVMTVTAEVDDGLLREAMCATRNRNNAGRDCLTAGRDTA
jgi:hypothetical protein